MLRDSPVACSETPPVYSEPSPGVGGLFCSKHSVRRRFSGKLDTVTIAATPEYLTSRVRLELGDVATPFTEEFFADGIDVQYHIDNYPLDHDSLVMTVNGQPFSDFTLDPRHGTFLFAAPPPAGAVISVAGVRYRYFNDTDISVFINEAIAEHSRGRLDQYGVQIGLSRIQGPEVHLIAIRAVILALWALVTDASFDISIMAPDGVSIPRAERYQQLMSLLNARQTEYDEMAQALNLGMFRTEVYTLRRVAKLTNRLVPLYMTKEFDDYSPPVRLYTEISTQGTQFPIEDVPTIDLIMRRGEVFSTTITLNKDITALSASLKALVMLYPGRQVPRAEFVIDVLDEETGEITLSMEPDMSKFVPTTAYWQLTGDTEELGGVLLAQGKIQAERATQAITIPLV